MKTVAVIPARMASTRLPDKPLADIHGTPMIVRVAQNISLANLDRVVVAVDHQRVFDVVTKAGFEVVMTRTDHTSGSDRVMEVAQLLELADEDLVINVQGDEPLMPAAIVEMLADRVRQGNAVGMATVSEPILKLADFVDPNIVKVVTDQCGQALYFSRAPIPYPRDTSMQNLTQAQLKQIGAQRHIGIYAYRVGALEQFVALNTVNTSALEHIEKLEQLRWLEAGQEILVLTSPQAIPGGVDTVDDLERVRQTFLPN